MTRADRLVLWSCGLAIAASVAIGAVLVARRPGAEPRVAEVRDRIGRERQSAMPPPSRRLAALDYWEETLAGKAARDSTAMYLLPPVVEGPPPKPPDGVELEIDPVAVLGGATGSLNGATIAWTLEDPEVALEPHESRKRAPVEGFVVERSRAGKPAETVAEPGPEARAYTDRTAEPLAEYRFRVRVAGGRTALTCPSSRCGRKIAIPRERGWIEVRIPSARRVKLVGGDAKAGIFRVDAYDRSAGTGTWKGGDKVARPGEAIGSSGWRLEALRFEKSTLTAEVVDDEGVARTLSTGD